MANKNSVFVDNSAPAVNAEWLNINQTETNTLITTSGQTVDNTGLVNDQEAIAVASYAAQGGVFGTDSGVADAYVFTQVSPFKAPFVLKNGMTIRFRAGNANTGACTVNAFGSGVKSIKKEDGTTNPSAGNISISQDTTIRYNLATDVWIIDRTPATQTEVNTGTNTQNPVTSATLNGQPVFRARRSTSNQTITANVDTKIQFNVVDYDVGSFFNTGTYRFQPTVAGKYLVISSAVGGNNGGSSFAMTNAIWFNGSRFSSGFQTQIPSNSTTVVPAIDILTFNGSTDYAEIYVNVSAGTTPFVSASNDTNLSIFKIR